MGQLFVHFSTSGRVAEAENRMKNEDFCKADPAEVVARLRSGKKLEFGRGKGLFQKIFELKSFEISDFSRQ